MGTEVKSAATNTIVAGKTFVVQAYGAAGGMFGGKKLEQMEVKRTGPQEDEVLIEILYCGVCHSDVHQVANDWKNTIYPCVPGHEIIGRVTHAGSAVTKYSVGDTVGVGCMLDSCQQCKPCKYGEEQYCHGPHGPTMTYNGYFIPDGTGYNTFGGYSTHVVIKEKFVLKIPVTLNIKAAGPILCAGVTTYSPLKHWNIKPGDKVGIAGIGGLGHMAVMIAKAMGAYVVAITSKEEKRRSAMALGADDVLVSENDAEMQSHQMSLDFILVTIPESFNVNDYICLLNTRGSLVTVGLLGPYKSATNNMEVAKQGRSIGGSLIGGIAETQEVLEFCAKHNILPIIEMINIQDINDAFEKVKNEDVRFRYVIDMQSLKTK